MGAALWNAHTVLASSTPTGVCIPGCQMLSVARAPGQAESWPGLVQKVFLITHHLHQTVLLFFLVCTLLSEASDKYHLSAPLSVPTLAQHSQELGCRSASADGSLL